MQASRELTFIASSTSSASPALTAAPCATCTLTTLPGIGETTDCCAAALPPAAALPAFCAAAC